MYILRLEQLARFLRSCSTFPRLMWKGLRPNESLSRRYRTHDVVPRRGFGDSFRIEKLCRGLVDAHGTKVILPHRQDLDPSERIL